MYVSTTVTETNNKYIVETYTKRVCLHGRGGGGEGRRGISEETVGSRFTGGACLPAFPGGIGACSKSTPCEGAFR